MGDLARGFAWQRFVRTWLMAQPRADLVVAPEWGGAAAAYATVVPRPALVTQLHGSSKQLREHSRGRRAGPRGALPSWLNHRREIRQTRRSDAVVGCSKAILDDTLRRWKLDPAFRGVIPNTLNVARARTLAEGPPPPLPQGRRVLFFGRLEARKGVHVLAEAMNSVFALHADVHLVLAGSNRGWRGGGSMLDHVLACVGEHAGRVVYVGELLPEVLMPLIRVSDVVALPSLWEPFGFTFLEAMALGRPLVSTSGHGADDFVASGQNGLLVPSSDARALADAINRLLGDETLAKTLGTRAAQQAEQYAPEMSAKRTTGIFEQILAQTKP
jgi:glycosyltransferase involved in cell wall biosynthesis